MVRAEMADQVRKSLQRPLTSTMSTAMGRPSRAAKGQPEVSVRNHREHHNQSTITSTAIIRNHLP